MSVWGHRSAVFTKTFWMCVSSAFPLAFLFPAWWIWPPCDFLSVFMLDERARFRKEILLRGRGRTMLLAFHSIVRKTGSWQTQQKNWRVTTCILIAFCYKYYIGTLWLHRGMARTQVSDGKNRKQIGWAWIKSIIKVKSKSFKRNA